mmetsp:Transcript_91116/g.258001  ORF Transcript_91116/g.258001 Transcript_91116/m.258001 type:complete len:169 (+) Transcript_91116:47-553(+)
MAGQERFPRVRSLPSLSQGSRSTTMGGRSPFGQAQTLCTVQVGRKRLIRHRVGVGTVRHASETRLPFVAFERGLEWQQPHTVSRPEAEVLPPFAEIVTSAIRDLRLEFPPRRGRAPADAKKPGSSAFGGHAPYRGGPRLPLREDRRKVGFAEGKMWETQPAAVGGELP